MDPIAFSRIAPPSLVPLPKTPAANMEEGSFADLLTDASARLGELQGEADTELRRLLASEKAGLASQLMMSVRNKVVDAYQEIMRMQV